LRCASAFTSLLLPLLQVLLLLLLHIKPALTVLAAPLCVSASAAAAPPAGQAHYLSNTASDTSAASAP
jgi:hypothetical protein